jgi:hypothetical protein
LPSPRIEPHERMREDLICLVAEFGSGPRLSTFIERSPDWSRAKTTRQYTRFLASTAMKRSHSPAGARQFSSQPGPGHCPASLYGCRRGTERGSGLLDCEAREIPQFDYATLLVIHLRQTIQRSVQCYEVDVFLTGGPMHGFIQGHLYSRTATLVSVMGTGMLHKDPSHHTRGNPEKMGSVLQCEPALIDQSQVRFVDQRRRLERVVWAFSVQITAGYPVKLVVDGGKNLVQYAVFPLSPFDK